MFNCGIAFCFYAAGIYFVYYAYKFNTTDFNGRKLLNTQLILEKYTNSPILLTLSDDNMLECGGIIIADNVLQFDAVTDVNGTVHGVVHNADGHIFYFRLSNGLPVSKSIAANVSERSLKHLSITEEDGILHILLIKCDRNMNVYHYRTQGNTWVRSYPKSFDLQTEYISCCPCNGGKFALLMDCNGKRHLYIARDGRFNEIKCEEIPDGYTDVIMSHNDGNIELIASYGKYGVKVMNIAELDQQCAEDKSFVIKEIKKGMEDNMANGNIINSKYISDLQNNISETEKLKNEITELREKLDSIQQLLENAEKQYKYLSVCRDTLRQHDTQLNQANIRIQELANRLNGIARRG